MSFLSVEKNHRLHHKGHQSRVSKTSYSEEVKLLAIRIRDMPPSWLHFCSLLVLGLGLKPTKLERQNHECTQYIQPQRFGLVFKEKIPFKNRQVIIYYLNKKFLLFWFQFCFGFESRSSFVLRLAWTSLGNTCCLQI